MKFYREVLGFNILAMILLSGRMAMAQNIAWTGSNGITGDANLSTNGSGFDALILNTSGGSSLSADGITFNVAASQGGSSFGDGTINYTGASLLTYSWPGSFPISAQASSAFAAVMDAGGIYQDGGSGSGTITISGLKVGTTYAIQIFNYATDGDPGLTTFSGSPAVTLDNLPGAAGSGTYGEFATGTFVATNTSTSFTWNGAGSSYTVVGAVSIRVLSTTPISSPAISWGNATGITGDASLSKAGTYFDALMVNSSINGVFAVDGINFNHSASLGGNSFGDGIISYTGSGLNNFAWANSFPTNSMASPAFATLMDDGGIYQTGGAGTGVVEIAGLLMGHSYQIQVFNFAPDGDPGLTTLTGATSVTLDNLPGAGGINTYGEFATGTFFATSTTATFDWNGDGSSYTVLGCIAVRDVSAAASIYPTNVAYQGDTVMVEVNPQPVSSSYQWQTDGGSGGASWTAEAGANNTNYILNTADLAPGIYEFRVAVSNIDLNLTSAPVSLTLLSPSAPVIAQDTTPGYANPFVGQGATFAAAFTGNQPITNQWQTSQDGGLTFSNLPSASGSILILTNLQPGNAGEYRLLAANAYGTNASTPATLVVRPWSAAQIQWSGPFSIDGSIAGQILTNLPGAYLEAADFFDASFIAVQAGGQQFVFRSDGASASIADAPYYGGVFVTNAIYGSGALDTNFTGDPNLDGVLDQYYDGGFSNVITLHNLVPGQTYSVQLFALDDRPAAAAETADFADVNDSQDVSPTFSMPGDAWILGTFTATNTSQSIQENLFANDGSGNINALIVRALSYTPSAKPVILGQPRQSFSLVNDSAAFAVVADGAPAPGSYQWKGGVVGGPYTNLVEGGRFNGTTTRTLVMNQVNTNDSLELVVAVTNAAGGVVSGPVDLTVPVIAQPVAAVRPVRITCVGASDVSTPTPYGTPNWPDYIAPMLGYEYAITNCGASGTTMIKNGNAPYWSTPQYTDGLNSSPDIVIIMLGSNDSKPYNWIYQTNYVPDYEEMIGEYRSLPSHPRIYLNTLLTVYTNGNYDITDPIVTGQLCPIIRQIAFDENLPLIDVNAATKNMPQNFPDDVHPDIAGAKVVATTIFNGLMNAGETVPMTDRALNQPVVVSSVANGNTAANAVDADYTTMWSSTSSDSQWIYVDLGSVLNITGVYLNWGPNYGRSYVVQVSPDSASWTGVYTNNAGAGGIDRVSVNASGRYVRMLGLHSGTGNGYQLLDLTVTTAVTPPAIRITSAGSNTVALSWPVSSLSYALESTSSLQPPIAWAPLTNNITVSNGADFVSVTAGGTGDFFQLKQKY